MDSELVKGKCASTKIGRQREDGPLEKMKIKASARNDKHAGKAFMLSQVRWPEFKFQLYHSRLCDPRQVN